MMRKTRIYNNMVWLMAILFTIHCSLFTACTPTPQNVARTDAEAPIYPDYRDVTIPRNIAPLNFLLRAEGCEALEVSIRRTGDGAGSTVDDRGQRGDGEEAALTIRARGSEATFDADDWRELMEQSAGGRLEVTVTALISGQWRQYRPFGWTVAEEEIDPYLTYRLIEPDYEIWNQIRIEERCLESFDTRAIGHYEQLDNRCMNCHTYAGQSPGLSMMYVRGAGGGAILNREGRLEKLSIPGSVYFGFSPSGRYITYSTQKIIPAFHSDPRRRLEVFDAGSNVFVADLEQRRVVSSPLTADSLVFETFPTFSPDGRYIYYCAADTVSLPRDIRRLQYALVRIAFDEGAGRFGERVDTVVRCTAALPQSTGQRAGTAASGPKGSVCHPRISPDGRWLLYTVADYGTFPIWHPEADLRMLDLKTGATDTLAAVNSPKSDTYHSWSSNSRWFVFASKRDDGLYGKPYFCYIDASGRAHKPFCLPQKHPTFYDNCLKSFNAPELGRGPLPFDVADVARAMKQEAETFE